MVSSPIDVDAYRCIIEPLFSDELCFNGDVSVVLWRDLAQVILQRLQDILGTVPA